jgi:hypothetical protein
MIHVVKSKESKGKEKKKEALRCGPRGAGID